MLEIQEDPVPKLVVQTAKLCNGSVYPSPDLNKPCFNSFKGGTESWFFPVSCLFCLKKYAAPNPVIFEITESWLKIQNLMVLFNHYHWATLWLVWAFYVQKSFALKRVWKVFADMWKLTNLNLKNQFYGCPTKFIF